jgi:hypothetical protein
LTGGRCAGRSPRREDEEGSNDKTLQHQKELSDSE